MILLYLEFFFEFNYIQDVITHFYIILQNLSFFSFPVKKSKNKRGSILFLKQRKVDLPLSMLGAWTKLSKERSN